jgi:uncharacterized protein (DUF983 family)
VSDNRPVGAFGVLLLIGAAIFGTATLVVVSGDPPRWAFAVVTAMVTLGLVVIALYTKGRS